MSKRPDIASGNLVYTCNCGWVDKGHATHEGDRWWLGAKSLWNQILSEHGQASKAKNPRGFYVIFGQDMRKSIGIEIRRGKTKAYWVKKGLSRPQKESVALAIFLEVAYAFEHFQGQWPYYHFTDSSFSLEDLVSDLLGFYRAVRNVRWETLCRPVSRRAALKVWDDHIRGIVKVKTPYGDVKRERSIGDFKNKTTEPRLFPCKECKGKPQFPRVFRSIRPAKKGLFHRDWSDSVDGKAPYKIINSGVPIPRKIWEGMWRVRI